MPQTEQPRHADVARYSFRIPSDVKETLVRKFVVLNVPPEMRPVAIDYVRDAGGSIIEASQAARWLLRARTRTERVFLGTMRDKVVLDVELAERIDDHSWQVVMRGRGEELYYGHEYSQAIARAGRQALERLSK